MVKISILLFLAIAFSFSQMFVSASSISTTQTSKLDIYFLLQIISVLNPFKLSSVLLMNGIPSDDTMHDSRLLVVFSIYAVNSFFRLLTNKKIFSQLCRWMEIPPFAAIKNETIDTILLYIGLGIYFLTAIYTMSSFILAPWRAILLHTILDFNGVITVIILSLLGYYTFSVDVLYFLIDISRFLFLFLYLRLLVGQPPESPFWWRWKYRLFGILLPAGCLLVEYNIMFLFMVILLHMFTAQLFVSWPLVGALERCLLNAQIFFLGRDVAISGESAQFFGALTILSVDYETGLYVIPAFLEAKLLRFIINMFPTPFNDVTTSIRRSLAIGAGLCWIYLGWLSGIRRVDFWDFKPPILMDASQYALVMAKRERAQNNLLILSAKRANAGFKRYLFFSPSALCRNVLYALFTRSTPFTVVVSLMHGVFGYYSWEFYTFFMLNVLTFEIGRIRCLITFALWTLTMYLTTPLFVRGRNQRKRLLSPVFVSKVLISIIQLILHVYVFPVNSIPLIPSFLSMTQGTDPSFISVMCILNIFIFSCAMTESALFSFLRNRFSLPFLLTEFGISPDGTFSASITTMNPSITVDFPKKVSFYPLERSPLPALLEKIVNSRKDPVRSTPQGLPAPSTDAGLVLASSVGNNVHPSQLSIDGHVDQEGENSSSATCWQNFQLSSMSTISFILVTVALVM